MMLVDDVVLYTSEKGVLEVDLEQWGGEPWRRLERRYQEQIQSTHVRMECQQEVSICHFPGAIGHRIHISRNHPAEQWRHEYISEQDDMVLMKQMETDCGARCDTRIPLHVNGNIHKMIVHPAILYEMETVLIASSNMKKLEETEVCQTLREHMRTLMITSRRD